MNLKLLNIFENYHKLEYFGQCDKIRCVSNTNEAYWHEMMKNKIKISIKEFINGVNFNKLLDDDESPEQWIGDALKSDPTSGVYKSNWGKENVMFFQTAGFEFIFK